MNLYSFVEHPFTNKAYFNYDKFKDVVYKAQRLMDDVVDLEEEKINIILNKIENDPEPEEIKRVEQDLWIKIKEKLLLGRRTGLSAIGLADTLSALNYTYASDASIELAEEIYKQFAISAYKSSIDMSEERGKFPIYDYHKEKENPFLKRLGKDEKGGELGKYSRRNIALLTVPPSGTISMMAGISSGIEPVYQLYYKRRYKILENTEEKKQYDFIDANGDKWREYIVLHPKFKEYIRSTFEPEKDLDGFINQLDYNQIENLAKLSPYYNSTAYEIDPIQRVKLQGTIQKWIDHSISSTINLKEDISEAEVATIYETAWKEGCKGITVYRNNSRTGVLVDVDKQNTKEFKQHDAPKRPKSLDCKLHPVSVKGEKYTVLVGLLEDKPYEVFALENHFTHPGKLSIIKEERGRYTLRNEEQGWNISENLTDEQAAITRLVSTALRHGADIKFIVEQLNKTEGDLTSFSKAISRALKNYIKDNEKSTEKCPECGGELRYEGGCLVCQSCGNSKCG